MEVKIFFFSLGAPHTSGSNVSYKRAGGIWAALWDTRSCRNFIERLPQLPTCSSGSQAWLVPVDLELEEGDCPGFSTLHPPDGPLPFSSGVCWGEVSCYDVQAGNRGVHNHN